LNLHLDQPSRRKELLILFSILLIYFFIFLPLSQVYLKNNSNLYNNWNLIYFIITLFILFIFGKINVSKVGLGKTTENYFILSLVIMVLPIACVALLDTLLATSGLSEKDIFIGAKLRESPKLSILHFLLEGVFKPTIILIFTTGYVLNTLVKKKDLLIPVNGILYGLINLNLGIGFLGIGIIAAGLIRYTGSLIPAIHFGIGCSLAKLLIVTTYPRITTLLVFLV
tara:strand:- start:148 stop:825 length:678 start_codon:yes stop_codon:yes gene_type:complete